VLEKLGLDAVVVHIHFGMSGSFRTFPYPGKFTFFFFSFFLSSRIRGDCRFGVLRRMQKER
jgi:hypothetical protein